MMDFSSKRGENHSNSELLRGFSTKCRREIRIFMSQEEQNTALAKLANAAVLATNAFVRSSGPRKGRRKQLGRRREFQRGDVARQFAGLIFI